MWRALGRLAKRAELLSSTGTPELQSVSLTSTLQLLKQGTGSWGQHQHQAHRGLGTLQGSSLLHQQVQQLAQYRSFSAHSQQHRTATGLLCPRQQAQLQQSRALSEQLRHTPRVGTHRHNKHAPVLRKVVASPDSSSSNGTAITAQESPASSPEACRTQDPCVQLTNNVLHCKRWMT